MKVKEAIKKNNERIESYGLNLTPKTELMLKYEEQTFRELNMICPYCDEVQELEEFFPNLSEKDSYICESCEQEFIYKAHISYMTNAKEESNND